jgi:hypothetical protein
MSSFEMIEMIYLRLQMELPMQPAIQDPSTVGNAETSEPRAANFATLNRQTYQDVGIIAGLCDVSRSTAYFFRLLLLRAVRGVQYGLGAAIAGVGSAVHGIYAPGAYTSVVHGDQL